MRVLVLMGAALATMWSASARAAGTTCAERAKEYGDTVTAGTPSSATEWDRLGRDCLERRSYADGIRIYRRALTLHPDLKARMANLAAIYSESGQHEVAYCLTPDNKRLRKTWERTKQTARLCTETENRKFTYVPIDLP